MRTLMFALLGSASLIAANACAAQTPTKPGQLDWPTYGGDHTGARFSGAKQITPANVSALTPAWTFHMRPAGRRADRGRLQRPAAGLRAAAAMAAMARRRQERPTQSAAEKAQASAEGVAPRRRSQPLRARPRPRR
jgi:quinoprotein glucose dehydrogenase